MQGFCFGLMVGNQLEKDEVTHIVECHRSHMVGKKDLLMCYFCLNIFFLTNNPCCPPKDIATFKPKCKIRLWADEVKTSTKPKVLMLMENAFKTIFCYVYHNNSPQILTHLWVSLA